MRAFYRSSPPVDGVNDFSTNSGHPVPTEELSRLQLRVLELGTGPQAVAQAKSNAQQSGYPDTDGFKFDVSTADENQFKEILKLIQSTSLQNVCSTCPFQAFLINNDGAFMDFEDPINNKWIRIELTTGDFISAPAGIVFRAGISPESLKTVSSLVALKMPAGNLEALFAAKHFVVGKDAEKYRSEYIKALQE